MSSSPAQHGTVVAHAGFHLWPIASRLPSRTGGGLPARAPSLGRTAGAFFASLENGTPRRRVWDGDRRRIRRPAARRADAAGGVRGPLGARHRRYRAVASWPVGGRVTTDVGSTSQRTRWVPAGSVSLPPGAAATRGQAFSRLFSTTTARWCSGFLARSPASVGSPATRRQLEAVVLSDRRRGGRRASSILSGSRPERRVAIAFVGQTTGTGVALPRRGGARTVSRRRSVPGAEHTFLSSA